MHEYYNFLIGYVILVILSKYAHGVMQDIALKKNAYIYPENLNATILLASLAVDGDESTCMRTDEGVRDTRLTVDLGARHTVTSIEIISGNWTLPYIEVFVADDPGGRALCKSYNPETATSRLTVFCFTPNVGRYVTIANTKSGGLAICNLRINECIDGMYGQECDETCHCRNDGICNKRSGFCDTGCDRGYTGPSCQLWCADGLFGYNCDQHCHCQYNVSCDKTNGTCPNGKCKKDFYGPSCQTELPYLKGQPTVVETFPWSITLQWRSWMGNVEDGYSIQYRIEYKERKFENKNSIWSRGNDLAHKSENYQRAPISNLEHNTFYYFRIVPYLKEPDGTLHRGIPSPEGGSYRTKCISPNAPTIEDISSVVDETVKPERVVIIVKWKSPSLEHINCDSLKYFKIHYKDQHAFRWQEEKAANSAEERNITNGIEFGTEYRIMVVAINNQDLSSSSAIEKITTPAKAASVLADRQATDIGLIAGLIIGVTVMLSIAMIVIILYRKRKSKYVPVPPKDPEDCRDLVKLNSVIKVGSPKKSQDISPTGDSGVGIDHTPSSSASGEMATLITNNPPVCTVHMKQENEKKLWFETPVEGRAIKVCDLEQYIMERKDNESEELRKEYKSIPEGFVTNHDHGKSEANRHKNRFINIIAYNHSRVILEPVEGDPESDYVNANYIDGYCKPGHYIAAQGCNKWTIQDMWRMVWQEHALRIVMVTNLIENGKRKCEQYWPISMNENKLYGDICVRWIDTEQTSEFVIRTFELKKNDEMRNVKQLHFTAWPDHGVPNRASPIIHFRRKVRSYDESHPGVILVHCSAGVGRTGTFIALDYSLDKAVEENEVDVYGLTQVMRKQRVNMIQTEEQYLFVYDALLEALKSGNTAIPCSDFRGEYSLLCRTDAATGKSKLQLQFEILQAMTPRVRPDDCAAGASKDNESKNRVDALLPPDRHRPYLMTRVPGTNDYINAVFLDGYKSRNAYIVTQMPLPHTVIDFWRMVYEHDAGTIVMLNPEGSDQDEYGQYWPEEEACECGPFVIEPVSEDTSNPDVLIREMRLMYQPEASNGNSSQSNVNTRTVNQFVYTNWPAMASSPHNKNSLINLIDMVDRSQLKTGNGPTIIHCHDGVRQSGLYASVSCIWEKMKTEQEVDIFHSIKQMRHHRPQIVLDIEQYQFCYEMVLAYLAEFALYANFEKLGPKAQPVYQNAEEIKKNKEELAQKVSVKNAVAEDPPIPPGMIKSSSKSLNNEIPTTAESQDVSVTDMDGRRTDSCDISERSTSDINQQAEDQLTPSKSTSSKLDLSSTDDTVR